MGMAGGRWLARGFSVGDNPYAGGQHRGVDIALGDAAAVRAPCVRGGCVRRTGPDARPHGDDRRPRWIQGLAHPSGVRSSSSAAMRSSRERPWPRGVRRSRSTTSRTSTSASGSATTTPTSIRCRSFRRGLPPHLRRPRGAARTGAAGSRSRARATDWRIAASLRARAASPSLSRARARTDTDANSTTGDRGVR